MFPRLSAVPPAGGESPLAGLTSEISSVHIDVSDAIVADGQSSAAALVRDVRGFGVPVEVHFRGDATWHLPSLAAAGAGTLIVDLGTPVATLFAARQAGLRVGVTFGTDDDFGALAPLFDHLDVVLVGAAAASGWSRRSITRVARVREMIHDHRSTAEIQVEGGVDAASAPALVLAGADTLVVGKALFETGSVPSRAARELRAAALGLEYRGLDTTQYEVVC